MDNRAKQRRYTIFAVFMVALMGLTAILPSLQSTAPVQQNIQPTATIIPTFPAPPADLTAITFNDVYLHPSGLYMFDYPADWPPSAPTNNGSQISVAFNNTAGQSTIEKVIEIPVVPVTTLQEVSARYDDTTRQSAFRRYNTSEETGRQLDTVNNAVVIDYELTLRGQTYLARQVAKLLPDGRIEITRVATPDNARSLLLDLLDKAQAAVHPVSLFAGTPVEWNSYYSDQENMVIRYPPSWVLRDGGPGQPVTIEGTGLGVLRVESVAGTVADADAAEAFVTAQRPGATIHTVQTTERNGAEGWEVSYSYRNLEGEPQSALTVILPDGDDTLRVATVRVVNFDVDLLNNDLAINAVSDAKNIAQTFNLTTGLGFPVAEDDGASES